MVHAVGFSVVLVEELDMTQRLRYLLPTCGVIAPATCGLVYFGITQGNVLCFRRQVVIISSLLSYPIILESFAIGCGHVTGDECPALRTAASRMAVPYWLCGVLLSIMAYGVNGKILGAVAGPALLFLTVPELARGTTSWDVLGMVTVALAGIYIALLACDVRKEYRCLCREKTESDQSLLYCRGITEALLSQKRTTNGIASDLHEEFRPFVTSSVMLLTAIEQGRFSRLAHGLWTHYSSTHQSLVNGHHMEMFDFFVWRTMAALQPLADLSRWNLRWDVAKDVKGVTFDGLALRAALMDILARDAFTRGMDEGTAIVSVSCSWETVSARIVLSPPRNLLLDPTIMGRLVRLVFTATRHERLGAVEFELTLPCVMSFDKQLSRSEALTPRHGRLHTVGPEEFCAIPGGSESLTLLLLGTDDHEDEALTSVLKSLGHHVLFARSVSECPTLCATSREPVAWVLHRRRTDVSPMQHAIEELCEMRSGGMLAPKLALIAPPEWEQPPNQPPNQPYHVIYEPCTSAKLFRLLSPT